VEEGVRTMASKQAVLGLVIERPAHGYEIIRRMRERCGPSAWGRSTIYRALEELEKSKHVRALGDVEPRAVRPRTVYEATPAGIGYFESWMCSQAAMEASRSELELKIVMARPHELPELIGMTWAHEQQCVYQLAALGRQTRGIESGGPLSWPDVGGTLVRDTEIRRLRSRIEFFQEARKTMKLFLDRTAGTSSRRPRQAG
jgi:DNA-binding PadR family transcriptional regulator